MTVARTDAENLEKLRTRRDELNDLLDAPETIGAFGGIPDSTGPDSVQRMAARAQFQSELEWVESRIDALEAATEDGPYMRESRGAY